MQINDRFPESILVDEIDMIANKKPFTIIAKDIVGKYIVMTKYLKAQDCFVSTIFNQDPRELYDILDVKVTKDRVGAELSHLDFVAKTCQLDCKI